MYGKEAREVFQTACPLCLSNTDTDVNAETCSFRSGASFESILTYAAIEINEMSEDGL